MNIALKYVENQDHFGPYLKEWAIITWGKNKKKQYLVQSTNDSEGRQEIGEL